MYSQLENNIHAWALGEMLAFFSWMAEETAVLNQHPATANSLERVREWIESELKKVV